MNRRSFLSLSGGFVSCYFSLFFVLPEPRLSVSDLNVHCANDVIGGSRIFHGGIHGRVDPDVYCTDCIAEKTHCPLKSEVLDEDLRMFSPQILKTIMKIERR